MSFNWPEVLTILGGLLIHGTVILRRQGKRDMMVDMMWADYCKRKQLNGNLARAAAGGGD